MNNVLTFEHALHRILHLRIVVKKSAGNYFAVPLHLGKFVGALKVVLFEISREDDG